MWAGNSPNVLHRHYKGLVKEADATEFWGLTPATVKSEIVGLTSQITDDAPVVSRMKPERARGVRCICLVRQSVKASAGVTYLVHGKR